MWDSFGLERLKEYYGLHIPAGKPDQPNDERIADHEDELQNIRRRLAEGDWRDVFLGQLATKSQTFSKEDIPFWPAAVPTPVGAADALAHELFKFDQYQRDTAFKRDNLALARDTQAALEHLAREPVNEQTLRMLEVARAHESLMQGAMLVIEPWLDTYRHLTPLEKPQHFKAQFERWHGKSKDLEPTSTAFFRGDARFQQIRSCLPHRTKRSDSQPHMRVPCCGTNAGFKSARHLETKRQDRRRIEEKFEAKGYQPLVATFLVDSANLHGNDRRHRAYDLYLLFRPNAGDLENPS